MLTGGSYSQAEARQRVATTSFQPRRAKIRRDRALKRLPTTKTLTQILTQIRILQTPTNKLANIKLHQDTGDHASFCPTQSTSCSTEVPKFAAIAKRRVGVATVLNGTSSKQPTTAPPAATVGLGCSISAPIRLQPQDTRTQTTTTTQIYPQVTRPVGSRPMRRAQLRTRTIAPSIGHEPPQMTQLQAPQRQPSKADS